MRIVTPQTSEQVAIEAGRQFDECYALAYAQQLKNKDIPEGGSKAVLLVDTTNSTVRGGGPRVAFGISDSELFPEYTKYSVDRCLPYLTTVWLAPPTSTNRQAFGSFVPPCVARSAP